MASFSHIGNYPIIPYEYPDASTLPFGEVFLRILVTYGIVCLGVISKASGLSIRYM